MSVSLVTGGSGYFGEVLVRQLLDQGETVRIFDLNPPAIAHPSLSYVRGDIRDPFAISRACDGVANVYHNVAQVPLAKNKEMFWSVNYDGTRNVLEAALNYEVGRLIYTSSSAVFGRPRANPVTEETEPNPMEPYGAAKLAGELLCKEYIQKGLWVATVRPRTILGHGRLGIFQILFEWIYNGLNVPVLGNGSNLYQFVHAEDLASAIISVAQVGRRGECYNIGAGSFGSMRESLEQLIAHAGTASRVKNVPKSLAKLGMNIASTLRLSPLGPYHALMYGETMYFDCSKSIRELNYKPNFTQNEMFAESYDWYVNRREDILAQKIIGSHHQSGLRQGILSLVPKII